MAGMLAEISLKLQLEEAERKGREEGMAALLAALSTADTGDQEINAWSHHHDNDSHFRTRVNITMVEAADDDDAELVLFLLKSGVDINTFNLAGHTALHCAVKGGHTELVEALLEAGANIRLTNDNHLVTPLVCAVELGNLEIVKALLAGIIATGEGPGWPANYGAEGDRVEMTQTLLEAGVYIGADPPGSWTPLMSAAYYGKTKAAALLIKAGCDVNAQDDNGQSVLMMAARGRGEHALNTIRMLLESGAEINGKDEGGRTALMYAATAGHTEVEVVRFLMLAGADVFSRSQSREAQWGEPARKARDAFDLAVSDAVKEVIKREMHRRIAAALSVLSSMPVDVRQKIVELFIED